MSTKDIAVFVDVSIHIFDILYHLRSVSLEESTYPSNEERITGECTRIRGELPYLFSLNLKLCKVCMLEIKLFSERKKGIN